MEKRSNLRKLVELIFVKSEIALNDSAIPIHLQGYDFYTKMRYVMFIRKFVITYRWGTILEDQCCRMLSSREMYLVFVMQACLTERAFNSNVFDCIISVCCLVEYFNSVAFQISGVNYSDMNSDIVMEFYYSVLQTSFYMSGGLKRFVHHVYQHKYLEWKWDEDAIISEDRSSSINSDMLHKLDKEIIREIISQRKLQPDFALNSSSYRKCVMMIRKVRRPEHIPEKQNLSEIVALRQNRSHEEEQQSRMDEIMSELNNLEKLLPDCSISNSDCTKTDSANLQPTKADSVKLHSLVSKVIEDFEKHEVIEAVTHLNRSKRSDLDVSDCLIRKKPKLDLSIDSLNENDKQ